MLWLEQKTRKPDLLPDLQSPCLHLLLHQQEHPVSLLQVLQTILWSLGEEKTMNGMSSRWVNCYTESYFLFCKTVLLYSDKQLLNNNTPFDHNPSLHSSELNLKSSFQWILIQIEVALSLVTTLMLWRPLLSMIWKYLWLIVRVGCMWREINTRWTSLTSRPNPSFMIFISMIKML